MAVWVLEVGGPHAPGAILRAVEQRDALLRQFRAYRVDVLDDDGEHVPRPAVRPAGHRRGNHPGRLGRLGQEQQRVLQAEHHVGVILQARLQFEDLLVEPLRAVRVRHEDPRTLARIRALVIPPAWQDVWICADPRGHIQAIGTDAAGRRQYRYHDLWREQRDQDKHDRVQYFGAALPAIRAAAGHHLHTRGLGRERVLAAAIRLIDLGFFRPGGEEYAEQNGTFGLATIRRDHVTLTKGQLVFEYPAKGAKQREQAVAEEQVCAAVRSLRRRRGGGDQLLAYRGGSRWHDVTAADINDYLREISGGDYTAKDFRTWHATVLAAVGLAVSERAPDSDSARKRAVARVVQEVADYL